MTTDSMDRVNGEGSNHILVPLDGSRLAATAVPYAAALARTTDARISLLAVVEPAAGYADAPSAAGQEDDERHVTESAAYLESVAAPLRAGGLTVTAVIRHGNTANVILAVSEDEDCSLIVMSTHGRMGLERLRMGSVAQHVVRHASIPTLVVPPGNDASTRDDAVITAITVPLDGSLLAETALPTATRLATALAVPLTLLQVIPSIIAQTAGWGGGYDSYYPMTEEMEHDEERSASDYLVRVATPLRATGMAVETVWQRGATAGADGIIAAYLPPSGLAVMASHGRGGVMRWVLGSTAEDLLDHAPCPILIVRVGTTTHAGHEDVRALAVPHTG